MLGWVVLRRVVILFDADTFLICFPVILITLFILFTLVCIVVEVWFDKFYIYHTRLLSWPGTFFGGR